MTNRDQMINAANLHWEMYQITGLAHHYHMALQYQKWAIETLK